MAYSNQYTNYIAYLDPSAFNQPKIGHLNLSESTITPLSYISGTPLTSLLEVIEIGESHIKPSSFTTISLSSVTLLPPLASRDVLCVGKNYFEHAKEFNSSGYDSSDKVDVPTHPVIFTKRSTSIVATGEEILLHEGFTASVDYEGEIGVIVGKTGFRIPESQAMDHVWGYTIINDVTARERQRDHKQFYIGKSPDTFCPMGPIAVPAHKLPKVLRVQTVVNGEERQNATTEDLIFSIPFLVKTLSEGQTLQPGDVIATGTPAGVGIGKTPPVFLKAGDEIEVSVTGLSTLKNRVAEANATNQTIARVFKESRSQIPVSNLSKTVGGKGLTTLNSKQLYYKHIGNPSNPSIIFLHGAGATNEMFPPLITFLNLSETHSLHLLDFEGHGLSPTAADSVVSMESYAEDVLALVSHAGLSDGITMICHSMGALVALSIAVKYPFLISKLILLGPASSPLAERMRMASIQRAELVRREGMTSIVDGIVSYFTSAKTKRENLNVEAVARSVLLGQDPEGFAKASTALAGWVEPLDLGKIKAKLLVITGDEDLSGTPEICAEYVEGVEGAELVILKECGHLHTLEDTKGVAAAVGSFLLK